MEKFKEILEVNIRYPMAYYGLGKAYITMNRLVVDIAVMILRIWIDRSERKPYRPRSDCT